MHIIFLSKEDDVEVRIRIVQNAGNGPYFLIHFTDTYTERKKFATTYETYWIFYSLYGWRKVTHHEYKNFQISDPS